jgi:aminopeptidase N
MMGALSKALAQGNQQLSVIDRVCLIRDTKALAEQGKKGATLQLLDLVSSFKQDLSYPVWEAAVDAIGTIRHLIDDDKKTKDAFNNILRDLFSEIRSLGWEASEDEAKDEPQANENTLLRPLIVSALGMYNDEEVIKEAQRRFFKFMEDPKANEDVLPASFRSAVFTLAIRKGGKKEFELVKAHYLTVDDPAEKSWSLRSLGSTEDPQLLKDLLQWILDSDHVRSQDKVFPFNTVARNLKGRQLAWDFLKANWEKWYSTFDGGFLVQHLVKLPSGFVTEEKADEVEEFFKPIGEKHQNIRRSIQQCLESIRKTAGWRKRELDNIKKWIAQNQPQ